MVHGTTQASIETRYEFVLTRLVPRFLDQHRLTYSGLAGLVGVERTTLSRFMNRKPGHIPSKNRPIRLDLLERIERVCSMPQPIVERHDTGRPISNSREGDLEIAFRNFHDRLGSLREYAPPKSLSLLPELVVHATTFPPPWGPSMCSNLLLTIMGRLLNDGSSDASPDLLRYTEERVRWLETSALERGSETFIASYSHCPIGYAGAVLARIGTLLDSPELIDEGIGRLLRAVRMPHEWQAGHWVNLFFVLEDLLKHNHSEADRWSAMAADAAHECGGANVVHAHASFRFPSIERHWSRTAPSLWQRIREARDEHEGADDDDEA